MTANRRIALNFIATYGRSLFSLVCGLFTGRWILMVLGETDYGLYGLIAGMTALIGFVNSLMSTSVARYYAFSIGEAEGRGAAGLEACRRWFNVAVAIHTVLPIVLIVIGYPMGDYIVRHFLTIPHDRLAACVWVWRCVCVTCFMAMVSVPFNAMYTAKQEIAELTIYSFCQTAVNVVVMYYMVTHPADWLVRYAVYSLLLAAIPQLIITVRALVAFPECRFHPRYMFDWSRFKPLVLFACWRFSSAFAILMKQQGTAILVNKILGPARNAAMAVGGNLSGQSQTLAGALTGALAPAITSAYGAGRLDEMRRLCLAACKLSSVFILVFALPLMLEAHEVLTLWLKNPPTESAGICICLLIVAVFENMTCGHFMGIFAVGRIVRYQVAISLVTLSCLPMMAVGLFLTHRLVSVGITFVIVMGFAIVVRVWYARREFAFSARQWAFHVFCPLVLSSIVSLAFGCLSRFLLAASFSRVCLTTLAVNLPFLLFVWFVAFTTEERRYVTTRIKVWYVRHS